MGFPGAASQEGAADSSRSSPSACSVIEGGSR